MRVRVEGDPVAQLSKSLLRMKTKVAKKMRGALKDAAKEILDQAREDIEGAGNFGSRWTQGLTIDSDLQDEQKISITLKMSSDEPMRYWKVFQYGKRIEGKPLLWIPLPGVDPGEQGDFFQTSRQGNLLLFKKEGGPGDLRPLRVAKSSVYIPKKFHLLEICRDVASELGALYRKNVGD